MDFRAYVSSLSIAFFVVGTCLVVTTWVVVARNWNQLPATIAQHFDIRGKPDAYGDKTVIWILPTIGTLVHTMGVGAAAWAITHEDPVADVVPGIEVLMATLLLNATVLLGVTRGTIQVGLGRRATLGRGFMIGTFVGLVVLLAFGLLRLR